VRSPAGSQNVVPCWIEPFLRTKCIAGIGKGNLKIQIVTWTCLSLRVCGSLMWRWWYDGCVLTRRESGQLSVSTWLRKIGDEKFLLRDTWWEKEVTKVLLSFNPLGTTYSWFLVWTYLMMSEDEERNILLSVNAALSTVKALCCHRNILTIAATSGRCTPSRCSFQTLWSPRMIIQTACFNTQ
jgi:hypothetical protein